MKNNFGWIFIVQIVSTLGYSQKGARLIVRGDDMGYSHSGNEAIIKAYKEAGYSLFRMRILGVGSRK